MLPPESMVVGQIRACCEECDELWRRYAHATVEHLNLIRQREHTSWRTTITRREIDDMVEVAAALREAARQAIRRHLERDHRNAERSRAAESCAVS